MDECGAIVTEEELNAGGAEGTDAIKEDEMFGGKVHGRRRRQAGDR